MLRVLGISGRELAVIDHEVDNVLALKRRLRELHCWPVCMQQLLHGDSILDDSAKVEVPVELCLVVLDTLSSHAKKVEAVVELVDCASRPGLVKTAQRLLDAMAGADMKQEKEEDLKGLNIEACEKMGEDGHVEILIDRTSPWNNALIVAARHANIEMARLLWDGGFPIDLDDLHTDDREVVEECLTAACKQSHVELARLLLEAFADPNTPHSRTPPLTVAAHSGHEEMVLLLVDPEFGANVNKVDVDIKTALMYASMQGHVGIVRTLLHARADVDRQSSGHHYHQSRRGFHIQWHQGVQDGKTALMWAAGNGHGEIVRLLVEARADKDLKDACGRTAITFASGSGHSKVVTLLMDTAGKSARVAKRVREEISHVQTVQTDPI